MYRLPSSTEKMCVSLYGNGEKTGEPILDTNSVRRTVAECNLFLDDLAEVFAVEAMPFVAKFCGICSSAWAISKPAPSCASCLGVALFKLSILNTSAGIRECS
jgi:hypothetical protein